MAALTSADKTTFIERVIQNTPALDATEVLNFFNVETILPTHSVGITNLANRYYNLLVPLMLPDFLLNEVCNKKTFSLSCSNISLDTFCSFLPERLRVDPSITRRILMGYNNIGICTKEHPFVRYVGIVFTVPYYFPEGLDRKGPTQKVETSSAFRKAMALMVEEHDEELLLIKENIEKMADIQTNTEQIRSKLKNSLTYIRTTDKLKEAFPKLAKFVPDKEKRIATPVAKELSEEKKRYDIIDSLITLGFNPVPKSQE